MERAQGREGSSSLSCERRAHEQAAREVQGSTAAVRAIRAPDCQQVRATEPVGPSDGARWDQGGTEGGASVTSTLLPPSHLARFRQTRALS